VVSFVGGWWSAGELAAIKVLSLFIVHCLFDIEHFFFAGRISKPYHHQPPTLFPHQPFPNHLRILQPHFKKVLPNPESMKFFLFPLAAVLLFAVSCKKDNVEDITPEPAGPRLIFKFKFDSTQTRLDNLGQVATVPSNHGAQCPVFRFMSSHYIEMTQNATTGLGAGAVLYHAPETTLGGPNAIDFDSSHVVAEGQEFYSLPLSAVAAGSYNYLRVSLAYQNYTVKVRANSIDFTGTLASFIGFNTYIRNFTPNATPVTVNANKAQGFWAFEAFSQVTQGQAPAGATTVPNPIFATSPIPQGSCLVTGQFASPLIITGNETHDVIVIVSLSTNQSFEWVEHSTPGIYEPLNGDTVTDMGIRGLVPIVQ
jgi:hypothetical protein